MALRVIFGQILLAIPLFFLLNYFEKKEEKKKNLLYLLLPSVYILIISALCESIHWEFLKQNIFLIAIFECIIRIVYTKKIANQEEPFEKDFFYFYFVSILISYLTYTMYIAKVELVLPSPDEFKNTLWLIVLFYLCYLWKDHVNWNITVKEMKKLEEKETYIVTSYAKLKTKYRNYITTRNKDLIPLLYAIMIYENYKMPMGLRNLKILQHRFLNKEIKWGIMQVDSPVEIDDIESIKIAVKTLEKIWKKQDPKKKNSIKNTLMEYNKEDIDKTNCIYRLYETIINFEK